jgi:hypothetical protein
VKKRLEFVMVHKQLRYPWDRGSVKIESKRGAMRAARRTILLAAMSLVTTQCVGYCQDAILPAASAARSGVPGYNVALRHSLFAPAQMSRSIVQRRRAALAVVALDEPAQARFPRLGMVVILDTPQEFARIVSDPQESLLHCPTTSI